MNRSSGEFDEVGSYLAAAPTDRQLMVELIGAAGFVQQERSVRPSTFDDPYVGARLYFGHSTEWLGEHLKLSPGERHAEPQAILNALKSLDASRKPQAEKLLLDIDEAYKQKAWKTSEERNSFETLWKRAGDLLREQYAERGEMRIFSTLEPCADYESQPSCACIIRACGITQAIYGSDDINPKGKGRRVLAARSPIPGSVIASQSPAVHVFPNIAVEESHEINKLFFTSFKLAEHFFESADRVVWNVQPQYAFFRLDANTISAVITENGERIGIQLNAENPIATFRVESQPWMGSARSAVDDQLQLESDAIDSALVLFCGSVEAEDVQAIVIEHWRAFSSIPGTIITTSTINVTSSTSIGKLVSGGGIKFYPGSFQRVELRANARSTLYKDHISNKPLEPIIALAKLKLHDGSTRYISGEVYEGNDLKKLIQVNDQLQVLTLFLSGSPDSVTKLTQMLKSSGQITTLPRIHTIVLTTFQPAINLEAQLRDYGRLPRGAYDLIQEMHFGVSLTGAGLQREVLNGLDPRSLLAGYGNTLAESIDWKDRRQAGFLFSFAVQNDKNFLRNKLLPTFCASCAGLLRNIKGVDTAWPLICSTLNAIHDLYWVYGNGEMDDFDHDVAGAISICGDMLDQLAKADLEPWFVDIAWRFLACASCSESVELSHWPKLLTKLNASEFLLREAICYAVSAPRPDRSLSRLFNCVSLKLQSPLSFSRNARVIARRITSRSADQIFKVLAVFKHGVNEDQFIEMEAAVRAATKSRVFRLAQVAGDSNTMSPGIYADLTSILPSIALEKSPSDTWKRANEHSFASLLQLIPATHRQSAVLDLMEDGDPTLRWASLLTFLEMSSTDFSQGNDTFNEYPCEADPKLDAHILRAQKTLAIRKLLVERDIYWFDRELFNYYAKKVNDSRRLLAECKGRRAESRLDKFLNEIVSWALPSLADLHLESVVFATSQTGNFHPEVLHAVENWRKFGRTIALVLPPIKFEDIGSDGKLRHATATPPLGLGSIAATLSAQGHFVKIFDAHHYRFSLEELANRLSTYDYVGMSVVQSTERSAKLLSDAIRTRATAKKTKIVHGGHARSLYKSSKEVLGYDYCIEGPGEIAFSKRIFASDI